MTTKKEIPALASLLRQRRQAAGVTPSEIDQDAYHYESAANLGRLSPRELRNAIHRHDQAIQAAVERKASPKLKSREAQPFTRQPSAL